MLLVDWQIEHLSEGRPIMMPWCDPGHVSPFNGPMLEPFSPSCDELGTIPYGLTSAGYDFRLGTVAKLYHNLMGETIDPKRFKGPLEDQQAYDKMLFLTLTDLKEHQSITIPPNSYMLGYTLEYIRMPALLKGRCVGKSTLARCGVIINTTPLEPEWEGHLTVEIGNLTTSPLIVYAGEGIAQVEFDVLCCRPRVTYADKRGRYQKQGAAPIPGFVR